MSLLQNKNLCIKLVSYYDYTEMHGQQNIKKNVACVEAINKICYGLLYTFISFSCGVPQRDDF
jgi:hypothetical protein